jgi:S1-C subfamily serine protease
MRKKSKHRIKPLILSLFLMIGFLIITGSTLTKAVAIENVKSDKVWNITLSNPKAQSIKILYSDNKPVIGLSIKFNKNNSKKLSITPPKNGWLKDKIYNIILSTKSVKSGKTITESRIVKTFQVEGHIDDIIFDDEVDNSATNKKEATVNPNSSKEVVKVDQKLSTADINTKYGNGVVYIEALDDNNIIFASGSGFIVDGNKLITNYHVIDKAMSLKITMSDGKKINVTKVLNFDINKDIAILQIENMKNLSSVKLGDSSKIKIGDECVAIGSPQGFKNTVSTGIISGIRESETRKGNSDFQISAPINHGSSGGALFENKTGTVIGIVFSGLVNTSGDLNFAIPINDLIELMKTNLNKTLKTVMDEKYPPIKNSSETFFDKLSDVPLPNGYKIVNMIIDNNVVAYYLKDFDMVAYDKLLNDYNYSYWKLSNLNGKRVLNYIKDNSIISITTDSDGLYIIYGLIR